MSGQGYQGPTTSPSGGSVSSVINRIRMQREKAAYEAQMKRETWKKGGMLALKFDKSLRDWQMARISSPDMKFSQFIMNPTAAAVAKDKTIDMLKNDPDMADKMPKLLSLSRYKELYKSGKDTVSDIYQNQKVKMQNKKAMKNLFGKGGDPGGMNDYTNPADIKGEKVPRDREMEKWLKVECNYHQKQKNF